MTPIRVLLCAVAAVPACQAMAANSHDTSVPSLNTPNAIDLADIRHLASRTGFGVSHEDVQRFIGLTREEAVEEIMRGFNHNSALPLPKWVTGPAQKYWTKPDLNREERRQFNQARDREVAMFRQWWISNMLQSPSPQTERMVLFWHDHFATSYHGLNEQSDLVARQNQLFRDLGMGSFRDLLKAMIRDPALLLYLNNNQNKKGKPNENLGRELLELFTLGEGHYDEAEVKEAARSLTGYTFSHLANMRFRLEPWNQDKSSKTLFGVTAQHDGDDLIDIILEQPATARFISSKLWHALVSDIPPNAATLNGFANRFRQSDYDISVLYRSMLSSTAFWHRDNRAALIKSPVDIVVGSARSLDYPKTDWQNMPGMLAKLGMDLFAPPNVSGWSEGGAYVAPGRLLGRYRFLDDVVKRAQQTKSGQLHTAIEPQSIMMTNSMSGSSEPVGEQGGKGGTMNSMMIAAADKSRVLQLRLAAENYHGPVEYRIDLVGQSTILWSSNTQTLAAGHDTEKYGRIENDSSLPWQSIVFSLDSELLRAATGVVVHFLNDRAGADGDRNLYVGGVQLGNLWIDGSMARQKSNCEPENSAYSGNLYCSGSVSLDRKMGVTLQAASRGSHRYSASGVYLIWANNQKNGNGTMRAHIALADVATPGESFENLSFELIQERDGRFYLNMDTFDCSPVCLEKWPDCAWVHDGYPELKSVSIPLKFAEGDDRACHYESLSTEHQELFNVLWMSVGDLLKRVQHSHRGQRRAEPLRAWLNLLPKISKELRDSRFATSLDRMIIDSAFAPPPRPSPAVPPPPQSYANFSDLELALVKDGLSVVDLLFPGIPAKQAIDLLGEPDWDRLSPVEKFTALVRHPLFQVH